MNGIKVTLGFLGLAWALAGLAAVTNSMAADGQLDRQATQQKIQLDSALAEGLKEIDGLIGGARESGQEDLDRARKKLARDEQAVQKASAELQLRVDEAQGQLAGAQTAADRRAEQRIQKQLHSLQSRLERRVASPVKRRDASARAVDEIKAEITAAVAVLEQEKSELVKSAAQQKAEVDKVRSQQAGSPWYKGLMALLLGLAALVGAVLLRAPRNSAPVEDYTEISDAQILDDEDVQDVGVGAASVSLQSQSRRRLEAFLDDEDDDLAAVIDHASDRRGPRAQA